MNGQELIPVEAESSPSYITAAKRSSIWLHWNYTYVGDGVHGRITFNYREQTIGFNSTLQPSIHTLAKRTGQNDALILESPVPALFNGRVGVTSANSTFAIHDLQYNDSSYQFSSNVKIDVLFSGRTSIYDFPLKPVVSITVNGMNIWPNCVGVEIRGGIRNIE